MPFPPLDHSEPFSATLGVMLYPARDEADAPKARAYAAQYLASAFTSFREAGGIPPYEVLAPILMDAGQPLADLKERWRGGRATGEAFKIFFALFNTDPKLASWNNAIKVAELIAKRFKVKGARTDLWDAKRRFLTVAHLWGAWSIREGQFVQHPEVAYDGRADFQSFLVEPRPSSRPPSSSMTTLPTSRKTLPADRSEERERRTRHCWPDHWLRWLRPRIPELPRITLGPCHPRGLQQAW